MDRLGPDLHDGPRLISGKRLGIIGMGRIGQAVARRARGFGLSVHYHNRRRLHPETEQELEATYWESLDQMLARMDVISIHCPHTPATYHLLSARRLQLLQPHAYVVNTARGEVIDENALTRMLQKGELAGAASTCSSMSRRSIRSCWISTMWCCCPIWARQPWRPVSTWARKC